MEGMNECELLDDIDAIFFNSKEKEKKVGFDKGGLRSIVKIRGGAGEVKIVKIFENENIEEKARLVSREMNLEYCDVLRMVQGNLGASCANFGGGK